MHLEVTATAKLKLFFGKYGLATPSLLTVAECVPHLGVGTEAPSSVSKWAIGIRWKQRGGPRKQHDSHWKGALPVRTWPVCKRQWSPGKVQLRHCGEVRPRPCLPAAVLGQRVKKQRVATWKFSMDGSWLFGGLCHKHCVVLKPVMRKSPPPQCLKFILSGFHLFLEFAQGKCSDGCSLRTLLPTPLPCSLTLSLLFSFFKKLLSRF